MRRVRINRFFTQQRLEPESELALETSISRHLGRVLRARAGDTVTLFNGDGHNYTASVISISKDVVIVRIQQREPCHTESPVAVTLGLALSKGDRFDWAIQKATELGVSAVAPLFTERVDFPIPEDRLSRRMAHWQQIVISACEQSGRARVPTVFAPQALASWCESVDAEAKYILDLEQDHRDQRSAPPSSLALLVGPEGGLTSSEIRMATQLGFHRLQLGPRVLRTETAPVVALSILGARWGDLGSNP